MNFFFCEACGKRVTDADLEHGLAKDKKLKGVYCKACAANVNTIEFTPLTNAQARAIAASVAPPAAPAAPVATQSRTPGDRRASNVRMAPAVRSATASAKPASNGRQIAVIGAVVGAVALTGAIVLAFGGGKAKPPAKDSKISSGPEPMKPAESKPAEPVKPEAVAVAPVKFETPVQPAPQPKPTESKPEPKPAPEMKPQEPPETPEPEAAQPPVSKPPAADPVAPKIANADPAPAPREKVGAADRPTSIKLTASESGVLPGVLKDGYEVAKDPPPGAHAAAVVRLKNSIAYPNLAGLQVNAVYFPQNSVQKKNTALFNLVEGAVLRVRYYSEPGYAMDLSLVAPGVGYHVFTKRIDKFTTGAWSVIEVPIKEMKNTKGKTLEPGALIKEIHIGSHGHAAGYTMLVDEIEVTVPTAP